MSASLLADDALSTSQCIEVDPPACGQPNNQMSVMMPEDCGNTEITTKCPAMCGICHSKLVAWFLVMMPGS